MEQARLPFPQLNLWELERLAERWAEVEFPELIRRVLLYEYRPPMNRLRILLQLTGASRFPVKYAVVFEICREHYSALADQKYESYMKQHQSVNHRLSILSKGDFSFCELRRLMTPLVYNELVSATGLYQTLPSERIAWQSALFGTNFSPVYQGGTPDNFENEWIFIVRKWDEDLPESVRIDEPYTVLYDADAARLPEAVRPEKTEGARYVFRQEGPTWTIVYDGVVLRGLKSNGFEVVHFLVKNPREQFTAFKLLTGIGESPIQDITTIRQLLGTDNIASRGLRVTSAPEAGCVIVDEKARMAYKKEWHRLKEELNEAERYNDLEKMEKARKDLEDFEHSVIPLLGKMGKSRNFRTSLDRDNDKIRKRIQRALEEIELYNRVIHRHFKSSLKCVKDAFCYHPDPSLPWVTE